VPRVAAHVETKKILKARGVNAWISVGRDLREGLFQGCEPLRHSDGPSTGVFYKWPVGAVIRAAWIRSLLGLNLIRSDIRELIERGRAPASSPRRRRNL
jgi:hypothetical protein